MTPEQIADSLNEHERRWLKRPQDRTWTDLAPAAHALEEMGLAKPVQCPTTRDFGHIASRKGLAVRAILKEQM